MHILHNLQLDPEELQAELIEFLRFYQRPENASIKAYIANQFAIWYMARQIRPKYILEVGPWNNFGTRILHDAFPSAKVITIHHQCLPDRQRPIASSCVILLLSALFNAVSSRSSRGSHATHNLLHIHTPNMRRIVFLLAHFGLSSITCCLLVRCPYFI